MLHSPEILTDAGRPARPQRGAGALVAWSLTLMMAAQSMVTLMAVSIAGGAAAQELSASPWRHHEFVQTRLIAAADGLSPSGHIRIGLQVELSPGWDTYWRTPGDSGVPTELDWRKSANLADAEIAWPLPKRLRAFGQDTFVYMSQVVIPVDLAAADPDRPLQINVKVDYGVCRDICVPMTDTHSLLVYPASGAGPKATRLASLIAQYVDQVPVPGPSDDFAIDRVSLRDYEGKTLLAIVARASRPLIAPDAFVEGPAPFLFGAPEVMLEDDGRRALLHLAIRGGAPESLVGQDARLTFHDQHGRAIERRIRIEDDRAID